MVKNKFNKPFDDSFIEMMNQTAEYLCENVQACHLAYVQSDEITLLLKKNNPDGDVFFGGRLCKMQSIIASLATAKFNQLMTIYNITKDNYFFTKEDTADTIYDIVDAVDAINTMPLYQFDCKVWDVITANDAMAWFLFRNIDCIRNSKQQAAQAYLSHKELMGLHTDDQIELLLEKTGIDWNSYKEGFVNQCEKGIKLDYIKNFTRPLPQEVVDKVNKINQLEVFDNYVVLYYDPDGKIYKETAREEAKRKDPILFGVIAGSNKLYYIADWVDEYCDLSLEKFIDTIGVTMNEIHMDADKLKQEDSEKTTETKEKKPIKKRTFKRNKNKK